jgi:hypothetical protein
MMLHALNRKVPNYPGLDGDNGIESRPLLGDKDTGMVSFMAEVFVLVNFRN